METINYYTEFGCSMITVTSYVLYAPLWHEVASLTFSDTYHVARCKLRRPQDTATLKTDNEDVVASQKR
jgi:hypothetical protein